jgi:signal transduction histidine kinase
LKRVSWVTWRLFFITLPVDVFALVFLSNVTVLTPEIIPQRIAVGLIAHMILVPFFAIGVRWCRGLNSWKFDLTTLILIGAIRGIVIVMCERLFNLPTTVSEEFRVFNSAFAFPTWFIFFAVAIESRQQYQREFKALFNQIRKVDQEGEGSEKSSDDALLSAQELISRLQALTSKLGSEIQQTLASTSNISDYAVEANKIQDLVNIELKPASKQLWKGNLVSSLQIFRLDLLRIVLLEQKLPVYLVITGSAPLLFVGIFGAYGMKIASIQTAVATVPVLVCFLALEKLYESRTFTRFTTNFLVLGFSYLSPILVQFYLIPSTLKFITETLNLALFQFALWFIFLVLLVGYNLFNSLRRQQHAVISSFETLLKDKKYSEFMNSENTHFANMEMSRYLHGEIQTGLTAAILLLRQASKSGDVNLARQGLENAVKILMKNHMESFSKDQISHETYLEQIVSGWSGIADVTIELNFIDGVAQSRAQDVVELIGEGVANAIRHGKATKILVSDEVVLDELCVHIKSDGVEMPTGESGLGTEMFNELTSSWSFVREDGQSKLTFTLPRN